MNRCDNFLYIEQNYEIIKIFGPNDGCSSQNCAYQSILKVSIFSLLIIASDKISASPSGK